MKHFLRWLVRPAVLIPLVLGAGVFAALFTLADIRKVLAIIAGFRPVYFLVFLLLMLFYEALRALQWHHFIEKLEVHVPLRSQLLAFAMGEVAKVLPVGNYFQNYVLKTSRGAEFGRTAAATTLIIWEEDAVCLVALMVLGLGAWSGWVRIAILVGVAAVALLAWVFLRMRPGARPGFISRSPLLRRLADEFDRFREGAAALLRPSVLAATLAYSALYLSVAALGLFILVRGLGITNASLPDVFAVYFFSLALGLIIPLPVDIGAIEVGGLGAFVAIGVGRSAGLSAMIVNRVLSVLASLLIGAIAIVVLHREVRVALHPTVEVLTPAEAQCPGRSGQAETPEPERQASAAAV